MKWLPPRLAVAATLALSVTLSVSASGEMSAPNKPDDGLMTRDTFTDTSTPAHAPNPTPAPKRTHTARTRLDSKDFLSVHHVHRHHRAAKTATQVAAVTTATTPTHPPKRRNPVVSFVYWWNGWVVRNFHTKVGTVMLGTVGAKS